MKVGILSDIHVDINDDNGDVVSPALAETAVQRKLDLLIIAGDISSDYCKTLNSLRIIESDSGVPVLFVPGNHDIWIENHPAESSTEIYRRFMEHPGNLATGAKELGNGWCVIGDLGWYDFSFGDKSFSFEEFSRMRYKKRIWQDSIKAVWDRDTVSMHKYFIEKLRAQLEAYRESNVILVTHVLPVDEFTVHDQGEMWLYLNAFLGSREYGELTEEFPNIKYSICGHVHYRKQFERNGCRYICNCLGYRSEWRDNDDAVVEIKKAMIEIEL